MNIAQRLSFLRIVLVIASLTCLAICHTQSGALGGIARFTDQPTGWLGGTVKLDWPILTNLRLDPYERSGLPNAANGSLAFYNWFAFEFWRFQFVQQEVAKVAQTAIEFPPMQPGASFNLEAVKAAIQKAMAAHAGEYDFFGSAVHAALVALMVTSAANSSTVLAYLAWTVAVNPHWKPPMRSPIRGDHSRNIP